MATLNTYSKKGEKTGTLDIDEHMSQSTVNDTMIKEYVVALRKNARQWSANTKGRSEVKHTTAKPHKQKGLGRARQGCLVAPHFRGGGVAFGPKPKFDQHRRINRKERRAVLKALIAEKVREDRIHIIADTAMDSPKTAQIVQFLKGAQLVGKRVLFIGESNYVEMNGPEDSSVRVAVVQMKHDNFIKSLRNIPKVGFRLAKNVSGYDLLLAREVVLTEAAWHEIREWLK